MTDKVFNKFGTINSHKEIVVGEKGTGKTKEMLKLSEKTGCYIITFSRQRAEELFKTARELGYNIPFPGVLSNLVDLRSLKDVIVDDADMIEQLKYLYNLSSKDIHNWVSKKLDRQFKRIAEEERK